MTLGDATVVFFTGPVFSALFASWMLGEPYGLFDRVASVVCLLGVAMVVRPQGQMGWGAVSALVGAMSGALAYCVVRKVGTGVHPMVHVVYFGALSFVGSAVMMFLVQEPRMPVAMSEWALMLALGGFAFVGQALLNRGLQLAPTGPATLMRNLDVVFAFILGITLFDEIPSWMAVLGALTIIACTVAMGLHKWGKRSLT
ncbi:hypothetical protein GGH91_005525 [Coemansia sp. RSA 2671]|nr:hypothetical protein GGH91_005525 [Coemansia sp. RSA 2671]KAJ2363589.1 hypothetical protein H4S02_011084 [Coemansia sp. RSA 2611]KAJ2399670.1 hypothetical protein GGI10_006356 [Coemansia sp. RSA 2530]